MQAGPLAKLAVTSRRWLPGPSRCQIRVLTGEGVSLTPSLSARGGGSALADWSQASAARTHTGISS